MIANFTVCDYSTVTAGADSAASQVGFPVPNKVSLSVPRPSPCPRGVHVAGGVFLLGAAFNLLSTQCCTKLPQRADHSFAVMFLETVSHGLMLGNAVCLQQIFPDLWRAINDIFLQDLTC